MLLLLATPPLATKAVNEIPFSLHHWKANSNLSVKWVIAVFWKVEAKSLLTFSSSKSK